MCVLQKWGFEDFFPCRDFLSLCFVHLYFIVRTLVPPHPKSGLKREVIAVRIREVKLYTYMIPTTVVLGRNSPVMSSLYCFYSRCTWYRLLLLCTGSQRPCQESVLPPSHAKGSTCCSVCNSALEYMWITKSTLVYDHTDQGSNRSHLLVRQPQVTPLVQVPPHHPMTLCCLHYYALRKEGIHRLWQRACGCSRHPRSFTHTYTTFVCCQHRLPCLIKGVTHCNIRWLISVNYIRLAPRSSISSY